MGDIQRHGIWNEMVNMRSICSEMVDIMSILHEPKEAEAEGGGG